MISLLQNMKNNNVEGCLIAIGLSSGEIFDFCKTYNLVGDHKSDFCQKRLCLLGKMGKAIKSLRMINVIFSFIHFVLCLPRTVFRCTLQSMKKINQVTYFLQVRFLPILKRLLQV